MIRPIRATKNGQVPAQKPDRFARVARVGLLPVAPGVVLGADRLRATLNAILKEAGIR
jgi:hypothetical protein